MEMLLFLLLQVFGQVTADPAQFIVAPANITALLGDEDVTFDCHIQGQTLFWRINGTLYNYVSIRQFRSRGIMAETDTMAPGPGQVHERLRVRVSRQNNDTKVVCQGTVPNEVSNFSEPAFLYIADMPLPPGVHWSAPDVDNLQVTWSEPFTWTEYPITSYSIVIETEDSSPSDNNTVLVNTTLSPSSLQYNVTSEEVPSCTLLAITMTATNIVGTSEAAIEWSALPDSPGEFLEVPNIEVTFTSSQTPKIYINFTFPYLCPYFDAMYTLIIRRMNGSLAHKSGPYSQSWNEGGDVVDKLIEDPGVVSNAQYTLIINVTTIGGHTQNLQNFDTYLFPPSSIKTFVPPVTVANRRKDYTVEIAVLAGVVAMALIAVFLVALTLVGIYCRRKVIKRKRECVGTVELPMVRNPIYEAGAVYEEIPALSNHVPPLPPDRDDSYVSIAASASKDAFYDECKSVDDAYMPMHSAGTLKDSVHSAGTLKDANSHAANSTDTAAARHAVYSNATPTRNSVRSNGTHQRQSPETRLDEEAEERYIIMVH